MHTPGVATGSRTFGDPTRETLRRASRIILAFLALAIPSGVSAADPGDACLAAKLKAASKFAKCRMRADGVFLQNGNVERRDASHAKCERIVKASFERAETRYEQGCRDVGDVIDVFPYLTNFARDV